MLTPQKRHQYRSVDMIYACPPSDMEKTGSEIRPKGFPHHKASTGRNNGFALRPHLSRQLFQEPQAGLMLLAAAANLYRDKTLVAYVRIYFLRGGEGLPFYNSLRENKTKKICASPPNQMNSRAVPQCSLNTCGRLLFFKMKREEESLRYNTYSRYYMYVGTWTYGCTSAP